MLPASFGIFQVAESRIVFPLEFPFSHGQIVVFALTDTTAEKEGEHADQHGGRVVGFHVDVGLNRFGDW